MNSLVNVDCEDVEKAFKDRVRKLKNQQKVSDSIERGLIQEKLHYAQEMLGAIAVCSDNRITLSIEDAYIVYLYKKNSLRPLPEANKE